MHMQTGTHANLLSKYAAPEQLASPCKPYDEKADIYSLGIILFELYNPFSSAMERAIAIDRLKCGIFPDTFTKRYPVVKEIVSRMMHRDPCQRPSAEDILNLAIFARNAIVHNKDDVAMARHDKEMAEMRHRYSQMKQEKEDLQRRLDDLENRMNGCQIDDDDKKKNHCSNDQKEAKRG
jgi:translation initiation factor 2-alpha kinase 1